MNRFRIDSARTWTERWRSLFVLAYLVVGHGATVERSWAAPPIERQKGRIVEVGLERREPWTTSRLTGSPSPPAPFAIERVFPSLTFDQPTEMIAIPGTGRLAIAESGGKIYSFPNQPDQPVVERDVFVDLKVRHPELSNIYGIAFHPQFATNRQCFICYVLKNDRDDGSHVARFRVTTTDPPRIDIDSEQTVLTWMSGGHNGGNLQFGPDGYLYISTGDGGPAFPPDPRNTGQSVDDLLASVLRIDVDHTQAELPYRIPADNPFVARPGARPEVWAYGFRNPWKMCFDPHDGSLWVGDVGWEMWEMIYRVESGGNYGWSLMEGPQSVHQERERGPTPVLPPAAAHSHTEARSITGGYVYTGKQFPELHGTYIYGDYVTGIIWGLKHEGSKVEPPQQLVDTPIQIVSFGIDSQGEIYIVDYAGTLQRLKRNPKRNPERNPDHEGNIAFPKKLSETGIFASTEKHEVAPGVLPYSINAEPWSDGAIAERFVALPGTSKLGVFARSNVQIGYIAGDWEFPSDGLLVKTVSIDTTPGVDGGIRRLETQVLHYDVDTWRGYNYVWNEAQTDADLVDEGIDRVLQIRDVSSPNGIRRQTWHHASRSECLLCHTTRSGVVQGFRPQQLQGIAVYRDVVANQLATLRHIGLFTKQNEMAQESWCDPYDESQPLTDRVRSYLHVNCAHCHRRGGGGSAHFDVQFSISLDKTGLIETRPSLGTFNMFDPKIVAAGDPSRSVLLYRMSKLGHGRMPQFGSQVVDVKGTKLIHDWISSLEGKEAPGKPKPSQADDLPKGSAASAAQIQDLLSTTQGALATLLRIESTAFDDAYRKAVIEAGVSHSDPLVRDLFERFVPEERRSKRLGNSVSMAEILSLPGDAGRGRELFLRAEGIQCRNCHRIGDQGKAVGPDLTQVGKKLDRRLILENILEPSKTIEPQFVTYVIERSNGQVITGLLVKRADREITVRTTEAQDLTIRLEETERVTPQQKSLMPDLLLKDMTAQQVADLIAFLSELR